ncbi:hypothetical protein TRFO_35014 [Tritrichomonas foetus]|uniref:Uncharacterized protein n=1 Tax=Tritrichomonas foetus TaxID=1144522 RepID=A0A1J4JHF9_9EUKA|nr:hypothetical protein TRFO_35014 [Tritrichomonas foetus]|eukprot:OHS98586.1 hypothetical protein TRFO_35014 [Tritrichomonas foetus]
MRKSSVEIPPKEEVQRIFEGQEEANQKVDELKSEARIAEDEEIVKQNIEDLIGMKNELLNRPKNIGVKLMFVNTIIASFGIIILVLYLKGYFSNQI